MLEACTGTGKFIEIWSSVGRAPTGAYTFIAHIIGHDENDVRLFWSLGQEGQESQEKLCDD